jgi:hypothetical protein
MLSSNAATAITMIEAIKAYSIAVTPALSAAHLRKAASRRRFRRRRPIDPPKAGDR